MLFTQKKRSELHLSKKTNQICATFACSLIEAYVLYEAMLFKMTLVPSETQGEGIAHFLFSQSSLAMMIPTAAFLVVGVHPRGGGIVLFLRAI